MALVACHSPCEDYYIGRSSLSYQIARDWPFGDGTAQGVWRISLHPNPNGTNCVDASSEDFSDETYAYTLEALNDGTGDTVQLYVDGVLFASGEYVDEAADSGIADGLVYQTGDRLDDTRSGGEITYVITGKAFLEANTAAGSLTWTGTEEIRVVASMDPGIEPDCTFAYTVEGTKVCDE